eukprot:6890790-Karenia_brevis.AAC.1
MKTLGHCMQIQLIKSHIQDIHTPINHTTVFDIEPDFGSQAIYCKLRLLDSKETKSIYSP